MKKNRKLKIAGVVVAVVALPFLYDEAKDFVRDAYAERMPRPTDFPASEQPDQICLTWSGDPATTQTIQWRTADGTGQHVVQYREATSSTQPATAEAATIRLEDTRIPNDPAVVRATAVLEGLEPATPYTYRVGHGETWSEWENFTTAPESAKDFSYLYFGDVQIGFETWGKLLQSATEQYPHPAFCLTAGDQVNRGNWREQWDGFFAAGADFLDGLPIVPAIGNHECPHGDDPWLYLDMFCLPENGPEGMPPERAYSFRYSNALFVVLDSNLPAEDQRPWLEQQLSTSNTTWKFVMYHHPAYSASPKRDNPEIREQWCGLFDKYHVDVAFQGHDHAYLRTPPMKGGKEVSSTGDGTIYVVSVAGDKFYEAGDFDYAAVAFEDTPTWQVVNIETGSTDTLTYQAYDLDGNLRDEFTIEKTSN